MFRTSVTLLSLLCVVSLCSAQTSLFERITIEQGLSQGMVFDLCQTRDGFIWAATKGGLNRYDGYNFKVFAHDPFEPFSLAGNVVRDIYEDSRGLLWVATGNNGLDVYNFRTGRFHRVFREQANYIAEDNKGNIWLIARYKTLVNISVPEAWSKQLPDEVDLSESVNVKTVDLQGFNPLNEELKAYHVYPDGALSVVSDRRIYQKNADQSVVYPIENKAFKSPKISAAYVDDKGTWLTDSSFSLYSMSAGAIRKFFVEKNVTNNYTQIKNDANGSVFISQNTRVWQLKHDGSFDYNKPDFELDRDAVCILKDRNGNIWIGTNGYGLRKINLQHKAFHSSVKGKSVWGLWRSPQGRYYWKRFMRICRFDPVTGVASDDPAFPQLGKVNTLDMHFEADGHFWVLGKEDEKNTGWLWHFSPDETLKKAYPITMNLYEQPSLLRVTDGMFWITGAGGQLLSFDPRSERVSTYSYAHLFEKIPKTEHALSLVQDSNGVFWIGTLNGLVKGVFSKDNFSFSLFQANPKNDKGLNNSAISCIAPDEQGASKKLWIGTKGGGINCLDLNDNSVQHLTVNDGLPDNVVYGILIDNTPDGQKHLWCSTNKGLAKIKLPLPTKPYSNKEGNNFITVYSASAGLQDNEFNTQSYFKASNGELMFGGVNGLNWFLPAQIKSDTLAPPVKIVGLEINHRPVNFAGSAGLLNAPVELVRELVLNHDQNNLSFEFAALDFTDPSVNCYRYRLEGVDPDWVNIGTARFAHFNHLAPGRYRFRVQGSNGESVWKEATAISITVRPPWYRSTFAYLCYGLLLLWAVYKAYCFEVKRVQLREQLAYEHREAARVKALEQMKANFFSNVTHEFRTPLTLILEPVRQLLQNPKDPAINEKLRLVERNSKNLLTLVNQLLDLNKLENGSMGLDLSHGDLRQTIRDVFETFLPLADQRGIKLIFKENATQPLHGMFDVKKVELVINNLISNALKFTPRAGKVIINAYAVPNPDEARTNRVEIKVSDSGIGIPGEALGKIFDRFYQVDSQSEQANKGTGIGLALSSQMANLMGGELNAESEPGKGTTFTFRLPIQLEYQESIALTSVASPEGTTQIYAQPKPSADGHIGVALIVEDNPDLRQFMRMSLEELWQVVEASDGVQGQQMAQDLLPDIVILDVMIPQKDGYTLCNDLKNNELTSHIPVILLTAKNTVEARIKGLRQGADDYLNKPFNTNELQARMENLVENRRKLREKYEKRTQETVDGILEGASALHNEQDQAFLRKFTLLIDAHLADEAASVETFAAKMHLSRSQLHRKLIALTNQSVSDYIRNYRLARAYVMLKNGEGNVIEVSDKTGFGNEKYFSRAFKEKYGVPPGKVR